MSKKRSGLDTGYPSRIERRSFLRAAGSLPLAYAIPDAAAASLASTPAAFDAAHDSVLIWVRGGSEERVRIDYGTDAANLTQGPVVTLARDSGYCAAPKLSGLQPGQEWVYRVIDAASGKPASELHRFRTAPSAPMPFSFAFSADMEDRYRPFRLFDVIDSKHPHFFLHLGDTVYADHPTNQFYPSLSFYRGKHAVNRRDGSLQKFLGRYVTYATWDDHETANDCHGGHENMKEALHAFKDYWPCQSVEPSSVYRHFSWSGVDFFMLDTRRFRSPHTSEDGPAKTMLGEKQKAWFKERLKASTSPFKFIMTSVPFHAGGNDTWGSYRTERSEVNAFFRDQKIGGVIFLTGDYHLARDWSNKKTGVHEFMAGPIASFNAYERNPKKRDQYEKTGMFHYGTGYNFGLWHVDPAAGKARLQFVGANGATLWETEVSA